MTNLIKQFWDWLFGEDIISTLFEEGWDKPRPCYTCAKVIEPAEEAHLIHNGFYYCAACYNEYKEHLQ